MTEKILIVDDDLDTLRLVGLMLQKQGYQIVAASDGKQGLLKAIEELPDLILLDVMMPEMDGYEVARYLRQNPKTAGTPILMFTAKAQLDDKVTGFESGADDYLTKPTHPAELQAHVKALLSRSVKVEQQGSAFTKEKAFAIGVISARGGLGVSSIALNLGSFLNNTGEETILVELISGKGTIGRDLGFEKLDGLTSLLREDAKSITLESVENALLDHETGLRLLAASEEPREMVLNNAISQRKAIFSQLTSLTHFLILDFGVGLPDLSQALLPKCDQIVIVVEAFENSIAQTKLLLENLLELGIEKEKMLVVLNNRVRSDLLLSAKKVQRGLDFPIELTFTPAPELFFQATRNKTTAIIEQPESMTAQQFQKLAKTIVENEAKER